MLSELNQYNNNSLLSNPTWTTSSVLLFPLSHKPQVLPSSMASQSLLFLNSLNNSQFKVKLLSKKQKNQSLCQTWTVSTLNRTHKSWIANKPKCSKWWCNRWWCSNNNSTKHKWWAWIIQICNSNNNRTMEAWEAMVARTHPMPMGRQWATVNLNNNNSNTINNINRTAMLRQHHHSKWTATWVDLEPQTLHQ